MSSRNLPMSILSKDEWVRLRVHNLESAIARYRLSGIAVPPEWHEEVLYHQQLKSKDKG